jgi:N-methylhydantoinase B
MARPSRSAKGSKPSPASRGFDPVRLEVFHHLFAAVAEEMGIALQRAAFSPNIKERRDFSCALFSADGEAVAQAAHVPVHLGSAPLSLAATRKALDLEDGDVAVLNDPYEGGTHLPDITLVAPVFLEGRRQADFYVVSRAHHADVGGMHPGSMAPAPDVHGEGLRIPPVKLVRAGQVDRDMLRLLLANMRVPAEREADLLAQWAALRVGGSRLQDMADEHGARSIAARGSDLIDWTESLTQTVLNSLPKQTLSFEDTLELTGQDPVTLRLALTVRKGRATFDFTATDDQVSAPVNTVPAVALSAIAYVLRLFLPQGTPTNGGVTRGVDLLTRPGSLIDARYPSPVASGNVETSQRLVDVLLGALAQAFPERVPAASAGTMSNLTIGSSQHGFAFYETLAGGAGGGPAGPGAHAVQTHMTNTRNTPIEALERSLPLRVLATDVRRGSGGAGAQRGGDGVVRRLRVLTPASIGWSAGRQTQGPWGLAGGGPGRSGAAVFRRAGTSKDRPLPPQAGVDLGPGDEIEVRSPGGGGHGSVRTS